jgi:hypothetical protein
MDGSAKYLIYLTTLSVAQIYSINYKCYPASAMQVARGEKV